MRQGWATLAVLAAVTAGEGQAADERRLLVLDMQFDSSTADGQTAAMEAADRARVAMAAERLAAAVAASEVYAPVDAPAVAAEIANYTLGACGRCELMLGRKAGADFVLVASAQKLSAMLITVQATIFDVSDGAAVAAATGVINANTDADWRRTIDRIAGDRLGLSAK